MKESKTVSIFVPNSAWFLISRLQSIGDWSLLRLMTGNEDYDIAFPLRERQVLVEEELRDEILPKGIDQA